MTTQAQIIPAATPIEWRKRTPLHEKLGPRAMRFFWPASAALPSPATPQLVTVAFDPSAAIDRVIGFYLSIASAAQPTEVLMSESLTNWQFSYTYPGGKGVTVWGNMETLPGRMALSVSFSVDVPTPIYLSLFNYEVVPCILA